MKTDEAIQAFINDLELVDENDREIGLKLETVVQNRIFYVTKNKNNTIIITPLEGNSNFSHSLPSLKRYMNSGEISEDEHVYTEIIGDYIEDKYIKEDRNMNEKDNLKEVIKIFMDKWNNSKNLWKNEFVDNLKMYYQKYTIKISFGKGTRLAPPNFPYICFLKDGQKISKGTYPYITYDDKEQKLITGLGFSWDKEPNINEQVKNKISEFEEEKFDVGSLDSLIKKLDDNIEIFEIYMLPVPKKIIEIKNIILYGVPGVGKTYSHKKLIDLIESKQHSDTDIFKNLENHDKYDSFNKAKEENRVKFITFHQSFGYEDFIEGFRPNKDGKIELKDGVFKSFCKEAKENKNENYYFIIDEINRGNISKIFGELITLIEEDKRDALHVELPYSKKPFSISSNIYIIGTMNSTDKSIALIDIALRRRFTFLKMKPNPELVENEKAKKLMKELNNKIKETLGEDFQIGHSYFMSTSNDEQLEFVKNYKIKPLLEEYFYGNEDSYNEILEVVDNE